MGKITYFRTVVTAWTPTFAAHPDCGENRLLKARPEGTSELQSRKSESIKAAKLVMKSGDVMSFNANQSVRK